MRRSELFNIFSDDVAFEVHRFARLFAEQDGLRAGVRNDGDREVCVRHRRDRQADTVNGDRAFFDDVAQQGSGGLDLDPDRVVLALLRGNRARAVDVAGDDVTAEAAD